MSDVYTFVAQSYEEGIKKANEMFGKNYYVLTHRPTTKGGILGIGAKQMIEFTCVALPSKSAPVVSPPIQDETNKKLKDLKNYLSTTGSNKNIDDKINQIIKVLSEIKNSQQKTEKTEHPNVKHLVQVLRLNDFPEKYIDSLVQDLKNELSISSWDQKREVENAALKWIAQTIQISPPQESQRPRVHVLIGATGVGKTTTIAKLAYYLCEYRNKQPTRKVSFINLDDHRVEAQATLKKYGEYMRLPVHFCASAEDVEKSLALSAESDHILVDTAGCNPKDFSHLADEKTILDSMRERFECLLTLSAVTKTKDIEDTIENFSMFKIRDVIVTKVDETTGIGNIIGTLWEHDKRIRYITNGQTVPTDFLNATKFELMKKLVGFSENVIKEFLKELENG